MCRVLAYLGAPVELDHFLFAPDKSLVRQTVAPQMLRMLNLAGFGMTVWDPASAVPEAPFEYRTTALPFFDDNLRALSAKIRATAVLAHVRGVPLDERALVSQSNIHPFRLPGIQLALAHNGDLVGFERMKFDLLEQIRPEISSRIRGTTDSEWIYALLLSQLDNPGRAEAQDIVRAVERVLRILRQVREKNGIRQSSAMNLFCSNGRCIVATRFTYDYGCWPPGAAPPSFEYLSLWYTTGRSYGFYDDEWKMIGGAANADSVLLSSEPLTRDDSTWVEVPPYSVAFATGAPGYGLVRTFELDV
jgi:glutamine amidotransferase